MQSAIKGLRCFHVAALVLAACGLLCSAAALADDGQLITISVHGTSLEDNLIGVSADREVSVYLPPSYDESDKRYPTVYVLHGIGDTNETWTQGGENWGSIAESMDKLVNEGRVQEMILVMPNQRTQFGGGFYTDSPVTGNWAAFTTEELVGYMDENYRTIPETASRGIGGHSMGGYGALTLAMKNPDVFCAAYGLNPAILGWAADLSADNPALGRIHEIDAFEDLMTSIYLVGQVCVAQAFSPNPDRPPFFADYPFTVKGGELVPSQPAHSQWEEHMPIYLAPDYEDKLKRLKGYRFDSGYDDEFTHIPPTCREFSRVLNELGVNHIYEEYNGDHRNRLFGELGRIEMDFLPFFSELLAGKNG